jgi:phage protein D/phage baseplate assembly protein gpV
MPTYVTTTVNGSIQRELEADLRELVVDTNLHLPAMFAITLVDEFDRKTSKLQYTDSDTFKVGAEVKIELQTDEIPDEVMPVKAVLIIGEVTAVEPLFEQDGRPAVRIRGYDRSHHLTRGKRTRTYGDANPTGQGIDDSAIIQTIVQETEGITSKKVDTSGLSGLKYPYVMQYNQTDLEFLWDRARQYGYQVYVEDKTLHFEKADAHRGNASDKPATLRWNWGLRSFEPRLTLMGQVDRAVVKGWEPDKKQPLEGTGDSDTSKTIPAIGLNTKGSKLAKEVLKGEADEVVLDHPVYTVDEASAIAKARFAGAESEFIQADGVCRYGDPRLIAGRQVTIEGVGERFSGDYYVTEARHLYQRGRYDVSFGVTGRSPNTLSHLLRGDNGHEAGRAFGLVPAKVVSLEDPQNLGRVQLMYPWLPKYKNADLSSSWARLANPMGGADRGFFFLPEIDDEVLVGFEHGDVNRPYVLGTLWNNTDKPPTGTAEILASDKKKVDQRVLRSRSGHLVVLNDKDKEEQVVITSKSGHTVILDDKQGSESITIKDKTGKNTMVIDSAKNSMSINVEGDFSVTAKGKITLTSTQDLTLDTKAMGNLKSGGNMTVKATGNLSLQATGTGEFKGTTATVDGGPLTTIKGALVKIN